MNAFLWRGRAIPFEAGETVAAALQRQRVFDLSGEIDNLARSRVFCGIGACQGCLVRGATGPAFESCLTLARKDMDLRPVLPLASPLHG